MVACVPQAPSESSGRAIDTVAAGAENAAPVDPAADARRLLEKRFPQAAWVESVTEVAFQSGLLQVTLDRPTATLGEVEVYTRMCNALTALIGTEDNPSPVVGVQFYRADGAAMVASGTANTPSRPADHQG